LGENYTCSCGEEVKVPIARFVVLLSCLLNIFPTILNEFSSHREYLHLIVIAIQFIRFKVVVQVEYQGSKADFIFWDNECQSIIGDTAEDIRQEMKKVI
jgi:hypothetical protein